MFPVLKYLTHLKFYKHFVCEIKKYFKYFFEIKINVN